VPPTAAVGFRTGWDLSVRGVPVFTRLAGSIERQRVGEVLSNNRDVCVRR